MLVYWIVLLCSCAVQDGIASSTSNTVKKSVLGGHHLIIGTIHISPYIIIERSGTRIRHVNGHVHQIIEWVAKRHNFTFEYVEPLDGAYGAFVNGSWNGLVGLLIRGEIDMVATALSITYPRSKFVDFTVAFSDDPISLLIPYPRLDSTISGIVKPFQSEVWIGIILSLLFVAIALWLISRFQLNNYPQSFHGDTKLIPHFWFLLRVVLANPKEVATFTFSTRLLVATWCLMAVVFINSYTGILVSYLMAPKFLPLITTVQSLADSREISVAVSKHTSVEAALFAATSGPLAKIGDQLRAHPEDRLTTLENIEDKVFYQGKAFAHEETTLFVRIRDDLLSTRHCRLAIAKEPLFSDQQALALPKSSPQTSLFNYEIVWLQQMGLLNYWRAAFLPKPNRCSAPVPTLRSTPTEKLTLNNLSSAFLLYFVGVVASVLAFALELISRKYRNPIKIDEASRPNESSSRL